ncbi:AMP-binding protein [Nocardioides sp.]|uniref:AMP-binding protein n=1 Tax=Nocardioides sp. TaxID=35761 RepID=UPI003519BD9E
MTDPLAADLGLGSWPRRRARIDAAAVALVHGDRSLTYGELAGSVEHLAAAFAALGVRAGDRVAYLGLNDVLTVQAMFAAHRLRAIFVPVNLRLAPAEVQHVLADAAPAIVVVGPDGGRLLAAALVALSASSVAHVVAVDETEGAPIAAAGHREVHLVAPLVEHPGAVAPSVAVALEDDAVILYTSGTTGRPRGAVLTHASLTWNTVNQLAHLDILSTDRALCIAPLFHAVGLSQVTLPVLFKGGTVEIVERFEAGDVLRRIEEHRISSFACVPTMLQLMIEHERWASSDLGSLRQVVYGGSPVSAPVAAAWRERGVRLQQGYGMTEASPGVAMAPLDGAERALTSVGVPHFFTDIALFVDDEPASLAPGDRGELLVRGPHVFRGYWRDDEKTEAAMVRTPSGDWYRTGDVLAVDEDGWLHVVDRVKDLIISGGENIYPAEIEALLVALPEVRSAAVVGRPDERWGEVGVAYVELAAGVVDPADPAARDALVERLCAHLAARLARFKLPQQVVVVDELPRNAVGKVLKPQLRADAAARTPQEDP